MIHRLSVLDTHTGGEPTRVVYQGGPSFNAIGPVAARDQLRLHADLWRTAVVCEPRGSETMVAAWLCTPHDKSAITGVVFLNDVGYLGMCGHGTIGTVVAMGHLGLIAAGHHRLETCVGPVEVDFDGANSVSVENVPCYRFRKDVPVRLENGDEIVGDIAWGGNWFFLVKGAPLPINRANAAGLVLHSVAIRRACEASGVTGKDGARIDHVELIGKPLLPENHGRSFVLCPGSAYDRSPCGTGTSAKIACLAEDGLLAEGDTWRQEGILGSLFEGTYRRSEGLIVPSIKGTAYVTAESTIMIDESDSLTWGIY